MFLATLMHRKKTAVFQPLLWNLLL